MPSPSRAAALLLLFAIAGGARAASVSAVEIVGLDEEMEENVRTSLSLVDAIGSEVTWRRLAYMMRAAGDETREALEPFGYYAPRIVVERVRDGDRRVVLDTAAQEEQDAADSAAATAQVVREAGAARAAAQAPVQVVITVEPGEPVRVRRADIAILGDGHDDRYLQDELDDFVPRRGSILDHAAYESSKARVSRRLAERGYFDADFGARRVAVTRAEHAAAIELVWSSGERYDGGPTPVLRQRHGVVDGAVLGRRVYWEQGQYYHQGRRDWLRTSLGRLDYFSRIDITPRPEDAVDREVPVDVVLTPAKRDVYTAGISYGTDSGAGVRLGQERRYVNRRGHKALWQV